MNSDFTPIFNVKTLTTLTLVTTVYTLLTSLTYNNSRCALIVILTLPSSQLYSPLA